VKELASFDSSCQVNNIDLQPLVQTVPEVDFVLVFSYYWFWV